MIKITNPDFAIKKKKIQGSKSSIPFLSPSISYCSMGPWLPCKTKLYSLSFLDYQKVFLLDSSESNTF
jgi:hypothetical protein